MLLSIAGGMMPGAMAYFLGISTDTPEAFRYSLIVGAFFSIAAVLPLLAISTSTSQRKTAGIYPESEVADSVGEKTAISPLRTYVGIVTLSATRGFSIGLTYPFFNVFFEEELYIGPAAIGIIFFASQLAGLPATFGAPSLVRKLGSTVTILLARSMGGGAVGIMGAFVTLPVAVSMFLLVRIGEVIDLSLIHI